MQRFSFARSLFASLKNLFCSTKDMMTFTKYSNRETLHLLVTAIFSSIILIGITAWFWELVDILTPFFMPFLMGTVWVFFLVVLLWSIVHIKRKKRNNNIFSFSPLIVQLCSIIIIFTVPFTAILLDYDFNHNLADREKVVSQIISGELKPNESQHYTLILLPPEHRHLSKGGGDIMVEYHEEKIYVFFFTYRGILDNFSGFMYRSDGTPPQNGDFGGDYFQTKWIKDNWYWVASF